MGSAVVGALLVFEVPLPPMQLSPNRKLHHMMTSRAVAAYREDVRRLAWAAWARTPTVGFVPFADKARVALVFGTRRNYVPVAISSSRIARMKHVPDGRYRPRDEANATAAAKALYDGLVSAGLLVDDSAEHMEAGRVRIDRSWGPGVRVTVEALG